MQKNIISWIVLSLLFGLAMLGLGIRHGVGVGEANSINEKIYKSKMATLTVTPQVKDVVFKEYVVAECKLSFLLPENISTTEAQLGLICPDDANSEGVNVESYIEVNVEGVGQVFIKSKNEYIELIRRTLEVSE